MAALTSYLDDTNPKSATDPVLIHADTEVFVAPRPRTDTGVKAEEAPRVIEPSTLVSKDAKGKGRDKGPSVKLRLVPGRIASQWGQPELLEGISTLQVGLCSARTITRLKEQLSISDKSPVHVSLRFPRRQNQPQNTVSENRSPSSDDPGGSDEGISRDLHILCWDEVPDGHIVLGGKQNPNFPEWAQVK